MPSNKIAFAHLLRGIAALSVVAYHLFAVFWIAPVDIANLMGIPPLGNFPEISPNASFVMTYSVVSGQFGVGVFFVLSGFVVPFALAKSTRREFLVRRALRIYPVYIAGLTVSLLAIAWINHLTATPFKHSPGSILSHFGILTRGLFGFERIDGISWTLEVELVFYIILAAVGAKVMTLTRILPGIAIVVGLAVFTAFLMRSGFFLAGAQVSGGTLLFIGMCYHASLRGMLPSRDFLIIQIVAAVAIPVAWRFGSGLTTYTVQWVIGYLGAMAVFGGAYLGREFFEGRRWPVLSHLSDVSYPLYAVHALLGYTVMYRAVDAGWPPISSAISALVVTYLAAVAIHIAVERPSQAFRPRRAPVEA